MSSTQRDLMWRIVGGVAIGLIAAGALVYGQPLYRIPCDQLDWIGLIGRADCWFGR